VIASPPSDAGAVNEIVAEPSPAEADNAVGAPGTAAPLCVSVKLGPPDTEITPTRCVVSVFSDTLYAIVPDVPVPVSPLSIVSHPESLVAVQPQELPFVVTEIVPLVEDAPTESLVLPNDPTHAMS
jgi:hypothetical protein